MKKSVKLFTSFIIALTLCSCSSIVGPTSEDLKAQMNIAADNFANISAVYYQAPILEASIISTKGDSIIISEQKNKIPLTKKSINLDSNKTSDIVSESNVNGVISFKLPSFDAPISLPGAFSADCYTEDDTMYVTLDQKTVDLINTLRIFEDGTDFSKIKFEESDFDTAKKIIVAAISQYAGVNIDENMVNFDLMLFLYHQLSDDNIKNLINAMPNPSGSYDETNQQYFINYDVNKETLIKMRVDNALKNEGLTRETATKEHIDELTSKYEAELDGTTINVFKINFTIKNEQIKATEFNIDLKVENDSFSGTMTYSTYIEYLAFNKDVSITSSIDKSQYVAFQDLLTHVIIDYKNKN